MQPNSHTDELNLANRMCLMKILICNHLKPGLPSKLIHELHQKRTHQKGQIANLANELEKVGNIEMAGNIELVANALRWSEILKNTQR